MSSIAQEIGVGLRKLVEKGDSKIEKGRKAAKIKRLSSPLRELCLCIYEERPDFKAKRREKEERSRASSVPAVVGRTRHKKRSGLSPRSLFNNTTRRSEA